MQPHIIELSLSKRTRDTDDRQSAEQYPQVGVVLDQRAEFKHVLSEVLAYLGGEALHTYGLERFSFGGSRRQRQLAARMAEIHLFQKDLAAGALTADERVFALTAEEANAAEAALSRANPSVQSDVNLTRYRLAAEIDQRRAAVLRELYLGEIAPDNMPAGSAATPTALAERNAAAARDLIAC